MVMTRVREKGRTMVRVTVSVTFRVTFKRVAFSSYTCLLA